LTQALWQEGKSVADTQVFISYRRDDTGEEVGPLAAFLELHFGRENVFRDVDTLPNIVGRYAAHIENVLDACHAVLVVIGQHWLTVVDDHKQRRLCDPNDLHRLEIEAALRRGKDIALIPVLLNGVPMPTAPLPDSPSWMKRRFGRQEPALPPELAELAEYQSHDLPNKYYFDDVSKLVEKIEAARKQREADLRVAEQAAEEDPKRQGERDLIAKANALAQEGNFQQARNAAALIEDRTSRIATLDTILLIARAKGNKAEADATSKAFREFVDQDESPEGLITSEWQADAERKLEAEGQQAEEQEANEQDGDEPEGEERDR
jgi:hypothetical protein